ncbi:hypothetical protein Q4577_18080 [Marinovum sp. 2_MG-2023]|uniref:hypothetical protein n=1 Tax=unclassified Marinovum TaxID=2647166 RepID=UPI0026E47B87|nr:MULTISPECIES: hypothetical protein [unclassified Marinovum]MDO6731944.1 hypothetical protein [Marinovum sp. 2_MG-2023]MDO6781196.1 hypothetical protein [Marinovum sp. 1_MG-2023]
MIRQFSRAGIRAFPRPPQIGAWLRNSAPKPLAKTCLCHLSLQRIGEIRHRISAGSCRGSAQRRQLCRLPLLHDFMGLRVSPQTDMFLSTAMKTVNL